MTETSPSPRAKGAQTHSPMILNPIRRVLVGSMQDIEDMEMRRLFMTILDDREDYLQRCMLWKYCLMNHIGLKPISASTTKRRETEQVSNSAT